MLYFLEDQHFAAIAGKAGTGKTFVACQKARMEAEKNENVLFLSYNALLAKHLRQLFSEDSKTNQKLKYILESPTTIDSIKNLTEIQIKSPTRM